MIKLNYNDKENELKIVTAKNSILKQREYL